MKPGRIGLLCAGLALLVAGGRLCAGDSQNTPPASLRYRITDLGTLGGDESVANAINDRGQVVGSSKVPFSARKYHACLWEQGRKIDLGVFSGEPRGTESWAISINVKGQIVGTKTVALNNDLFDPKTQDHAVLWENGKMISLGGHTLSATLLPYFINAAGTIVGIAGFQGHPGAFMMVGSRLTRIEGLHEARGINGADQIVGTNGSDACLWDHGKLVPLGMHGVAVAINDRGEVVGTGTPKSGLPHAFLWRNGNAEDIGTLGGLQSYATGINDAGLAVGESEFGSKNDPRDLHAFLYTDSKMVDLNSVLPAHSGWELLSARAINNKGQIVGSGRIHGEEHAFLLNPSAAGSQ